MITVCEERQAGRYRAVIDVATTCPTGSSWSVPALIHATAQRYRGPRVAALPGVPRQGLERTVAIGLNDL